MFIRSNDGQFHVDVDSITLLEKKTHENFEDSFFLKAYLTYPQRSILILTNASEEDVDNLIKKIWSMKDRNDSS